MTKSTMARCERCGEEMQKDDMRGDDEGGYICYCCIADGDGYGDYDEDDNG